MSFQCCIYSNCTRSLLEVVPSTLTTFVTVWKMVQLMLLIYSYTSIPDRSEVTKINILICKRTQSHNGPIASAGPLKWSAGSDQVHSHVPVFVWEVRGHARKFMSFHSANPLPPAHDSFGVIVKWTGEMQSSCLLRLVHSIRAEPNRTATSRPSYTTRSLVTRVGVTTWLAAGKLGRPVLGQFWTHSVYHFTHNATRAGGVPVQQSTVM